MVIVQVLIEVARDAQVSLGMVAQQSPPVVRLILQGFDEAGASRRDRCLLNVAESNFLWLFERDSFFNLRLAYSF